MSGRSLFASALAAAALLATPAMTAPGPAQAGSASSDMACTREPLGRVPAPAGLQATIDAIFDRDVPADVETPNGVTGEPEAMEVVMVRIKDGKPVLACVGTKEAATRFLTAPVETIGLTKTAEEK
jgi:hypothetical protein